MGDDIVELLGGFLFLTLFLGIVAVVAVLASIVVVPVGLAGAGTLYYLYNIHLPEKRRRETLAHIEALIRQAQDLFPSFEDIEEALIEAGICSPVLHRLAKTLYDQEGLRPPVLPPVGDDQIKLARYQDSLERFINSAQPDQFVAFKRHLIIALLPYESADQDGRHMFNSERHRTKEEIELLLLRFINDEGLFKPLVDQLNQNFVDEQEIYPSKSKHDDYAWRYLKNTPLLPLAEVSEAVSLEDRMYHTYVLGSSGSGKTNLIENVIAHDLASVEDCCVIVIDSQTQLIEKLARLDTPNTTYLTPKHNLALNLFDVGYDEMKGRGIEGETLINKTVGLLSFVLEGMMWAEFTIPQKTIFQYVIQLVISIPGGNINTFMDVLADGGHERYVHEISLLDENLQRFFTVDFVSPDYKRTREAIRRRMDSLLLNPTFRRLFSHTENRVDMFEEMATQNLVLIDTNKPMLDDAPSAFFGRLFIALILRASYRRFRTDATPRPVYLIVDEAHEYFDRSISDMLEQARKANIGLVLAHQSISQARGAKGGSNITDPLMVNTATKLIWTSFREDATKFAGSMQAKAEDILALPQFTFGMYSRNRGFLPVTTKQNALAAFPHRQDQDALQEEMEARYGPSEAGTGSPYPEPPDGPTEKDGPPPKTSSDNGLNDLGPAPDVETI